MAGPDGNGGGTIRWRVMRLDDNGQRFVAASGLDEAEARCRMAEFEAAGHKQTYWMEPEPVGPDTITSKDF